MPDVIVHFDPHQAAAVAARVRSLPNVAAVSLQLEQRPLVLRAPGHAPITSGDLLGTLGTRHGYKIVAGRDLSGRSGEVVIERGLASQWHLHPGDRIAVGGPATGGAVGARVVGVAVAPDNVAYPLASGARIWMPYRVVAAIGGVAGHPVNTALLWVNDRSQLGVTLEQARAAGYGLSGVNFITRDGVGVLIDGAAGIVIALLVAVSLGALVGAGVMVVASARAEVQRRLETIALLRAVGASPRAITGAAAVEAAMVALPSAALGLAVGWWAAAGASARLLEALDQFPRGAALLWPLAACLVAIVALVAAASAWPTWRACRAAGGVDAARRRAARRRAGAVAPCRQHRAGHADRRRPPGAHGRHHRGHGHLGRGRAAAAGAGDHAAAARARSRHDRQELPADLAQRGAGAAPDPAAAGRGRCRPALLLAGGRLVPAGRDVQPGLLLRRPPAVRGSAAVGRPAGDQPGRGRGRPGAGDGAGRGAGRDAGGAVRRRRRGPLPGDGRGADARQRRARRLRPAGPRGLRVPGRPDGDPAEGPRPTRARSRPPST